jgi:hypothetical protein
VICKFFQYCTKGIVDSFIVAFLLGAIDTLFPLMELLRLLCFQGAMHNHEQ